MKKEFPYKKQLKRAWNIFWADGKLSYERVTSLFSALFWCWLEWTFLKFFFTYAFGMYYAVNGNYPEAVQTILRNQDLINDMIVGFTLLIFVLRIPIHIKKEVPK